MPEVTEFRLLGVHPTNVPTASCGDVFYDAVDLVAQLATGHVVVFGFRTAAYLKMSGDVSEWPDGYVPLRVTLDLQAARFWDFNRVLWLGPEPQPCLVWSNADGISTNGLRLLLSSMKPDGVLAGDQGAGLPTPASLGILGWECLPAISVA